MTGLRGPARRVAQPARSGLDQALRRVTPPLRSWRSQTIRIDRDFPRELRRALESVADRATRMEAWIIAGGVGLPPAELHRLQRLVGTPIYTLGGPQPHSIYRHPNVQLTAAEIEWAVLATADVVYRLWQGDGLRAGEPWEDDLEHLLGGTGTGDWGA